MPELGQSGASIEWMDRDGQRVVIRDGRLSVFGEPSMTSDSGRVAIGADLPPGVTVGTSDEHMPRGQSEVSS